MFSSYNINLKAALTSMDIYCCLCQLHNSLIINFHNDVLVFENIRITPHYYYTIYFFRNCLIPMILFTSKLHLFCTYLFFHYSIFLISLFIINGRSYLLMLSARVCSFHHCSRGHGTLSVRTAFSTCSLASRAAEWTTKGALYRMARAISPPIPHPPPPYL